MNSKVMLSVSFGLFSALVASSLGQAPAQTPAPTAAPATAPAAATPAPLQTGPGTQAPNDAKYRAFVTEKCKNPPAPAPPRGAGGGGGGARAAAATNPDGSPKHREYKVTAIPGIIAEGATWKSIWKGRGNNADGPVATSDGGMLFAQNTNSKILKLDKNGKESFPYENLNTAGSVLMTKKGEVFVLERGLPQDILQVAPKRQIRANTYMGEPLDCAGGLVNDMVADSKGNIYFTKAGVYHADAKGVINKYGTVGGNGIMLSLDEKTLYVTGRLTGVANNPADVTPEAAAAAAAAAAAPGGARGGGGPGGPPGLVAFDVQPDGSLKNERQFSTCNCGDGGAVDAQGRVFVTGGNGVQVIDKSGKFIGEIASPLPLITVAFSGKDKKTLYGVANTQQYDEIFIIPTIAQGLKSRPK